jgi:hypothetical protein
MAKLVIDRAVSGALTSPWPRWEQMTGLGAAAGVLGQPAVAAAPSSEAAASARQASAAVSDKPAKPRAPRSRKAEA